MSEELQQKLRTQLWTVANTLRGNMSAGDFMYFTLGFIFYKYLSEKIELRANEILQYDNIDFKTAWESGDEELKEELKAQCIQDLGYFVEPEYLFSTIISMIQGKENILPALERSLKKIEDSTIGQESEDDFGACSPTLTWLRRSLERRLKTRTGSSVMSLSRSTALISVLRMRKILTYWAMRMNI